MTVRSYSPVVVVGDDVVVGMREKVMAKKDLSEVRNMTSVASV
jgi:hypothetical protein